MPTAHTCALGCVPALDCVFSSLVPFPLPVEEARGLTIQPACFCSPQQPSPTLSPFGLTLNSSPGVPQTASSSCFSCQPQAAEEVAVTDTAAPAVDLGGLPVTGAGVSVPPGCHVAPDLGDKYPLAQVKPAGLPSTDSQPPFLPLKVGGIWAQHCSLGLV